MKCKIVFEYEQYDGTNAKDIVLFLEQKNTYKNLKLDWKEDKGTDPTSPKFIDFKFYDPKQVRKEDVDSTYIFEGQYVVYNPRVKDISIVTMSQFNETYEEDYDDNPYIITDTGTNITSPSAPYCPPVSPWSPNDIHPWPEYDPHNFQVWCKAGTTGQVVKDPSNVVSSSQLPPNKEWVFGKPGIIDKNK